MDATQLLTAAFQTSLSDVIEHYAGERPEVVPSSGSAYGIGSVVGFAEERVNGCCVLTANVNTLRRLAPGEATDTWDWLGELNNQVVGRLKNKMVPAGLLFQLTPPVMAEGREVRFRVPHTSCTLWSAVWSGGLVGAMLALTIPAGLVLEADDSTIVAEEGSLNLF